jgi:hypothetical protein
MRKMSIKEEIQPKQHGGSQLVEVESASATHAHTPRKMTFVENVVLTIKVLAGFGILGAVLWGMSLWTSAK